MFIYLVLATYTERPISLLSVGVFLHSFPSYLYSPLTSHQHPYTQVPDFGHLIPALMDSLSLKQGQCGEREKKLYLLWVVPMKGSP
jgi:hypothetical protein